MVFFSFHFFATSMTNWAQIFTGLLFYGYDGIHQVRRLAFDNYQMCTFPPNRKSFADIKNISLSHFKKTLTWLTLYHIQRKIKFYIILKHLPTIIWMQVWILPPFALHFLGSHKWTCTNVNSSLKRYLIFKSYSTKPHFSPKIQQFLPIMELLFNWSYMYFITTADSQNPEANAYNYKSQHQLDNFLILLSQT